jgi:diacylglycerol kinase (ATP)
VRAVPLRVALLVNPTAGAGRGRSLVRPVLDRLRAVGADVEPLVGRDPEQAAALARSAVAAGVDVLAALGGDGLVGLAAQAVVGGDVPLAVVPAGTGNDAARVLGVRGVEQAVGVVLAGRRRRLDVGRVAGRVFLNVLSSGFDSRVNERANALRWPRGASRYPVAVLAELPVFRAVPYALVLDGEPLELPAMLVAVGNGPSYGGGMRVCPCADPADGLLDVTVLTPLPTWRFLRLFPSVYRGAHVGRPEVLTLRARTVRLSAPGMTAYADGEPLGPLPVEVEVVPGALPVLVP